MPGADGAGPATGVELLGGPLRKPPGATHESQADRAAQPLGQLAEHVPADVGGRSTLDGGGSRDAGQGDHGAPVGVDQVGGAHRGDEPAAATLVEATDVQGVDQPGALGPQRQVDDATHGLRGTGVQHLRRDRRARRRSLPDASASRRPVRSIKPITAPLRPVSPRSPPLMSLTDQRGGAGLVTPRRVTGMRRAAAGTRSRGGSAVLEVCWVSAHAEGDGVGHDAAHSAVDGADDAAAGRPAGLLPGVREQRADRASARATDGLRPLDLTGRGAPGLWSRRPCSPSSSSPRR